MKKKIFAWIQYLFHIFIESERSIFGVLQTPCMDYEHETGHTSGVPGYGINHRPAGRKFSDYQILSEYTLI